MDKNFDIFNEVDVEWLNIREEAWRSIKEREKKLFLDWKNLCPSIKDEKFAYKISEYENTLSIYSRRPGLLIGKAGATIAILKDLLKTEFGYRKKDWKVEIIEITDLFLD